MLMTLENRDYYLDLIKRDLFMEGYAQGFREGFVEGYRQGRAMANDGFLERAAGMVRDGTLTLRQASEGLGFPEDAIRARL